MEFESLVASFLDSVKEKDQAALTMLRNGEEVGASLTHFELAERARRLATWLVQHGFSGQRAMLMYPPGLEFIEAFMACLFANVIAVPVAPAPLAGDEHKARRILAILRDCQPAVVLGLRQTIDKAPVFVERHPDLSEITWFGTDNTESWLALDQLEVTPPAGDDLAFLQYTSGSTNVPKGVMLSHYNVLHNLAHFDHGWGHEADSKLICWLPHFHDLGLLYGLLFPLYKGISAYLLPPASVVQKPIRWLQAISKFGGTHSMGPNFIYEHCTDRITDEECQGLDLSTWRMALNAAEPIRGETIRRFNARFAPYGLSPNTLTGGFGLAEATCRVTAQNWDAPIRSVHLSSAALNQSRIELAAESEIGSEFISCGPPALGTVLKIVDPATLTECPADRIGEIWVQSGSVPAGYWKRPEENARNFGIQLAGESGASYMRTGDLGFIDNGELFITGRIKDLIIVGGENYYPQDAEWEIQHAHPAFKLSCCAVFSVDHDGEERIVVVQELVRHHDKWAFEDMVAAVRRSVGAAFELPVETVVFIRPGTTFKTSSGKIQRAATKAAYQTNELESLYVWDRAKENTATAHLPLDSIESYLVSRVAYFTAHPKDSIDVDRPFAEYGLCSIDATMISADVATHFGIDLTPTAFYDNPSIRQLVNHLKLLKPNAKSGRTDGSQVNEENDNTVVVVGLACRFPGARDASAYWKLLSEGGNAITQRTSADGKVRFGGFLDDITAFDNAFFSITPREAACLDPQQRIALETTWHAMEDAGIQADALRGSNTGVFFGASSFDYGVLQLTEGQPDAYTCQGSVLAVLANRISYQLDLCGPSFIVDTACSSALTALHLAVRSVRDGECDLAFAGAVHFLLADEWDKALNKAGMLAKDGQCKTFDASANGYVRGEGCAVIALKRYADAVRDGDHIYGAILGTGINQDGRSNGLTAPNGNAQEALMKRTLQQANVDPEQVTYIEAHGTGTPLGDPIECAALKRVFTGRANPCLMGSAKANIGHLEAAAGMAGLIKVLLAMKHNAIPKQINLTQVNPLIKLDDTLAIPEETTPWQRPAEGRRFAVASAFGFSGTNGCAVIGDVIASQAADVEAGAGIPFVLSARDDGALRRMAKRYADYFTNMAQDDWSHALYTSACRRGAMGARFATVADQPSTLVSRLLELSGKAGARDRVNTPPARPRIAFVYSGQGIPLLGAGRALHERVPAFAEALSRCDAMLEPVLGQSLASVLYGEAKDLDLKRPALAQPIQFALQYALTQAFASFGIQPDIVLGHSLGEYAALVSAGAMTLDDALTLVIARGEFSERLATPGAMAAIFADEATVTKAIAVSGLNVDLAAINGQHHCVVAGSAAAVAEFCDYVTNESIAEYRKLPVERAYHSALIEPVVAPFTSLAQECNFAAPHVTFISNLSGAVWPREQRLDADYLAQHLRQPVRFSDSLDVLASEQATLAIEIGSKPVLCSIGQAYLDARGPRWMAALRHGGDDWNAFMECLAQVFMGGTDIDWQSLFSGRAMRTVALPPYAFETTTHWFQQRTDDFAKSRHAYAGGDAQDQAPTPVVPSVAQPVLEPGLDRTLAKMLAAVIQSSADAIDARATFFELGVDSIGLVDFIQSVNAKYRTQLTAREIFESYPSLERLTERLIELQSGSAEVSPKVVPETSRAMPSPTVAAAVRLDDDDDLQNSLTRMLARVILSDAAQIDRRQSFFELGLDSISLVEFIQEVNAKYGTTFTAREIFESYTSIELVATCVRELHDKAETSC